MRSDHDGFGFRLRRPTPVVGATLALLVVLWIASALLVRFGGDEGVDIYRALTLQPTQIFAGHDLWSLLTSNLLHSLEDTAHLLMNGLVFYFFAPDLEDLWGTRKFVAFMGATMIGSDLFVLGAAALGLTHGSVVGFSGVVIGATVAWGMIWPDREMLFFFFRIKGLHMIYVTIAIQVLTALSFSNVSASAHFGGMVAAAIFTVFQTGRLRRWWLKRRYDALSAQAQASGGLGRGRSRARAGGPDLRVIKGGADEPPTDKSLLN